MPLVFPSQKDFVLVFRGAKSPRAQKGSLPPIHPRIPQKIPQSYPQIPLQTPKSVAQCGYNEADEITCSGGTTMSRFMKNFLWFTPFIIVVIGIVANAIVGSHKAVKVTPGAPSRAETKPTSAEMDKLNAEGKARMARDQAALDAKAAADHVKAAKEEIANLKKNSREAEFVVWLYERNEVKADSELKGTLVVVSGKIDTIAKDIMGTPYITLGRTAGSFRSVQCSFKKGDADTLVNLLPGQNVYVRGVVTGLLMNVQMRDCTIL
jgi:tRNA_anti-like